MTTKTEHAAAHAQAEAKAEHAAAPAATGTKIFRSEEDVQRTGGSRVVMQFTDAADDTVRQVDADNKQSRTARGIPAVGNLPREPFGAWVKDAG